MMLLFAYLLRLNPEWKDARIMVRSIVPNEEERARMEAGLAELIPEARIHADTEIILRPSGQSVSDIIKSCSGNADATFLVLTDPEPGTEQGYADHLFRPAEGLRTTIFVRNSGRFAGRLA
ncbi:MAG: hypothetical protein FJW35_03395 [Acidobacteria bacterium]|nr:hypothetical protein [Acidobacteriota bacterium]